jgi:phosphopantothenoylcysteine decarboxylase/phosphopantothenate--cysteine ligase
MAEPEVIAAQVEHFAASLDLVGMKVLVTAGPTVEDLDPVRFIGNRSSGKMGYALAARARCRGAQVWLVSGPTALTPPAGVELVAVRSTLQMQAAVEAVYPQVDAAILAAAVADYRPAQVAPQKLKRGTASWWSNWSRTRYLRWPGLQQTGPPAPDRFCHGDRGRPGPAREKLQRKNCDLVVLNDLHEEGAGFAVDTNVVTLIDAKGPEQRLPKMSKHQVADQILDWWPAGRLRAHPWDIGGGVGGAGVGEAGVS